MQSNQKNEPQSRNQANQSHRVSEVSQASQASQASQGTAIEGIFNQIRSIRFEGIEQSGPFGPEPLRVICPSCRQLVFTRVEHKVTLRTHVAAVLLCLFCCWCCVCLPYCIPACMRARHYCPNCHILIGPYSTANGPH